MSWLGANWPLLLASPVILALFGGGFKLASHWLDVQLGKRKATDDIAMRSNAQYEARVLRVEADNVALRAEIKAERQTCDQQLAEVRDKLNHELMSVDAILTSIRFAPDQALAVVAHIDELRARRRAEALEDRRLRLAEARHVERAAIRESRQIRGSGDRVHEDEERDAA